MSYLTIGATLDTILKTFADGEGISVAFENRKSTTDIGTPFLNSFLLPVATSDVGLAIGSNENFSGIYQVNVNYAKGDEMGPVSDMVDKVLAAFSRGTKSGDVLIERSYASPAVDINGAWHTVPINVEYRLFE